MNKKILILLILFFATGCWNYQELNSLAISTAMAIDKAEDGYEVSILIANSKKNQVSSKEGESQTIVYSAKGKTISDALKNIDLENPRQIYIGHLAVIVISEEVAKEGLLNSIDLLLRSSESTKRFYVAIAKDDKAKDVIKIISPLESFPSQAISTNIRSSSESQAISSAITYSKFVEDLIEKGVEPILPTVTIEGDKKDGSKSSSLQKSTPDALIKLGPIAVFKKDKLVGYATKDESRGINLILGKIKELNVEYKCDGEYLVTRVTEVKTSVDVKLKNKKPVVNITVQGEGDITENGCDLNLVDPKVIDKIEKNINKELKKHIKKGLKVSQEDFKTDILGFGNKFYRNYPKYYKSIKNWNKDVFPTIDSNIKVKINVITKGSARQSLKEAIHEK